ncbi:hypothetical protein Q8W27_17075, partial [Oceanobacter sp. 2_MG-2023]|uniref:hypothetical protein n=1 Tax=Oceanobacter sp. 2_MG-2023 TaxID=3062619 RepID=UPI002735E2CD
MFLVVWVMFIIARLKAVAFLSVFYVLKAGSLQLWQRRWLCVSYVIWNRLALLLKWWRLRPCL